MKADTGFDGTYLITPEGGDEYIVVIRGGVVTNVIEGHLHETFADARDPRAKLIDAAAKACVVEEVPDAARVLAAHDDYMGQISDPSSVVISVITR